MGLLQELGIRHQLLLARQLAAEKFLLLGELPERKPKKQETSRCASQGVRQQTRRRCRPGLQAATWQRTR